MADTPIRLSPETLAKIKADARKRVHAELEARAEAETKAYAKQMLEDETDKLRREMGLTSHLDDIVEYTPNVPPYANCFVIDGTQYFHGYTYRIKRSLYDLMREMEARGWDAEDRAGNPNRKYYRRPEMTQNPMLRMRIGNDGAAIHRETTYSAATGIRTDAPADLAQAGGL